MNKYTIQTHTQNHNLKKICDISLHNLGGLYYTYTHKAIKIRVLILRSLDVYLSVFITCNLLWKYAKLHQIQ